MHFFIIFSASFGFSSRNIEKASLKSPSTIPFTSILPSFAFV